MRFLITLAVFLLCANAALAAESAFGETHVVHFESASMREVQDPFKSLFKQKRFDELNKIAETYRVKDEKTPAGVRKLSYFYRSIEDMQDIALPDAPWDTLSDLADDWVDNNPSPAAYIIQARIQIMHGHTVHSGGYASAENPDKWKDFYIYLKKAHEILEKHKAEAVIDPEWYRLMIIVAKEEQWKHEDTAKLFAEAIEKHKNYYDVYFEIFAALQPKWGGSYDLMRTFADESVEHTKAVEGNSMYARLYTDMLTCNCGETYAMLLPDWQKIKAGIADYTKLYPDEWNYNKFARIACMAGDVETTRAMIGRSIVPIYDAWGDPAEYQRCKEWAFGP